MAGIDLSRSAHQPAKRFTSVRLQQGRVVLDDDWNEAEAIAAHERVESLIDVLGPSGTSDDAYLVTDVSDAGGVVDFALGEGTIHVGGRRLRVPPGARYLAQDDLFDPPDVAVPAGERHDLVWCELEEMPITAVEDAELREVGLGGPDTAARTRLLARVHVEVGVDPACEEAWAATAGAGVDARGVLTTDAALTVGFVPDTTPEDLCAPAVTGGYLSHDNQAIRVQLLDDTHLTWGFDNASPLYRVDLAADRQTLTFRTVPADEAHRPRTGQVVELLPWASVLPNGQLQAAASGVLAVVGEPYDPDLDQVRLTAALPAFGEDAWAGRPDAAALAADGAYVYLRVWDRGDDGSAPEVPFTPGGPAVPLGTTGLEVSLAGTTLRREDHWIIAARPAEPDRVVPWELTSGRPPHGPVRLRAPLAVLHWADGTATVSDCRRRFRPLTEQQGCCTVTVGDGSRSFGDVDSVQAAVDRLPPEGGRVCVRPGRYEGRVVVSGRTGVQITGCGTDVVLAPAGGSGPVVAVDGSHHVVLAGFRVEARDGEGVLVGAQAPCSDVTLRDLQVLATPHSPGVKVMSPEPERQLSQDVSLLGCRVEQADLDVAPAERQALSLWPAVWLQAIGVEVRECVVTASLSGVTGALGGLQLAGLTRDALVRDTLVAGGTGTGITLGSLVWVPVEDVPSAVGDLDSYLGAAASSGWVVYFDGRCLRVGFLPNPDDPDDPLPPVPMSEGSLENVAVEDCEVLSMGGDGIGVARFFEPVDEETADIISIDGLRIDRTLVEGNRRIPAVLGSPAHIRSSGQGGIALAHARDLRLRDNRIVANGRTAGVPTCGIFVLLGEGMLVTGNDVIGNGEPPGEDGQSSLGNRAGIFIRMCRDDVVGTEWAHQAPEAGALSCLGNRVSQPCGQALWALGTGRISVRDNELSAGNVPHADLLAAAVQLATQEWNEGDVRDAAVVALQHLVGLAVTVLDLGTPFDVSRLSSSRLSGARTPGIAGVQRLGVVQRGQPGDKSGDKGSGALREGHRDAVERERAVAAPVAGIDDTEFSSLERLLQGGHVSFSDNHVALDMLDDSVGVALCSVLVATLDDLAVHDNHVRCLTGRDIIVVDVAALSLWTLRVHGNRVQDVGLGRVGTLASALTWGRMNATTGNQTSGALAASASDPALLVDEHNLTW